MVLFVKKKKKKKKKNLFLKKKKQLCIGLFNVFKPDDVCVV